MADLLIHGKIRVTCGHQSRGACRVCITRDLVDPLDATIDALAAALRASKEATDKIAARALRIESGQVQCTAFSAADYDLQVIEGLRATRLPVRAWLTQQEPAASGQHTE